MLISLCIPTMNRTAALKKALPVIVEAANESPPILISILDYSSTDGLQDYMEHAMNQYKLVEGNHWKFTVEPGKKFYHSTHARNMVALGSSGDYLFQLSAEALPQKHAFSYIRGILESESPVWMCEDWRGRWIIIRRDEFIKSGGYDERFDAYAPEEKEFCDRLHRRGGKFLTFDSRLIGEIPTSNSDKLINLNVEKYKGEVWTKRIMHRAMMKIYDENTENNLLVANLGKDWGR